MQYLGHLLGFRSHLHVAMHYASVSERSSKYQTYHFYTTVVNQSI